ncbi:transposase [Ancylomarina sp. YFZ004]
MEKFKGKFRIESNRAKFWDYSFPADYFITICISGRECILGEIIDGKMILSEYGEIVEMEIKKIPEYHKRAIMNVWTVMPNHIHFIVSLGDYGFDNGISAIDNVIVNDTVKKIHEFSLHPTPSSPPSPTQLIEQWWINPIYQPNIDEIKQYRKERRKMIIPKILGKFKQQTSKQINIVRNTSGIKNWQSNYHDHIIRNDDEYQRIRNYIINNPRNWNDDKFKA